MKSYTHSIAWHTVKGGSMMNTLLYRGLRPEGWLLCQLRIQAQGLSGNLHRIWPDVRESAWIGGAREGWERVPYWLDGLIPLAHLLEDSDLIAVADRYIHAIVDRQQADGWICPCKDDERSTYDTWAVLLIGKVLAQHCEFKDDPLVERALLRTMKNLHGLLASGSIRLFDWGKFRWYEGLIPLLFLRERHPGEAWIPDLARILREQGTDYPSLSELWKRPMNKWTFETHIVNLCMMLKYEALSAELLGGKYEDKAEALWQILEQYNGTAVGTFTGDECLSGLGNNQGTELCAVVELMYALEWLYRATGKRIWADRLEKIAFNALPAAFTDDMWAHQYDQMVNQPACVTFPGKSFFRTNNSEAHLFGLEPHFGCCTANMHQGWPKLALHAIQQTERGILCAHLLPVSAHAQIGGKSVQIRIDSNYPFLHYASITIEAPEKNSFELRIRIPAWARHILLNGKPVHARGGHLTIKRIWHGTETFKLMLYAEPHMVSRPSGLKTVEYGPIVFSLPIRASYRKIEYTRDNVERKFPYCDYELFPLSGWNYGFADKSLYVRIFGVSDIPFSSRQPPLTIDAHIAPVKWEPADGYETAPAVKPVSSKPIGPVETIRLIPYGCAKLRMTEMPIIRK